MSKKRITSCIRLTERWIRIKCNFISLRKTLKRLDIVRFSYLDRYEKVHFLGEDGQQADDDDEDSRHRKWSARALHSVPLTYNHHQHNIAGELWSMLKLKRYVIFRNFVSKRPLLKKGNVKSTLECIEVFTKVSKFIVYFSTLIGRSRSAYFASGIF